jgi:hypothetical protein
MTVILITLDIPDQASGYFILELGDSQIGCLKFNDSFVFGRATKLSDWRTKLMSQFEFKFSRKGAKAQR